MLREVIGPVLSEPEVADPPLRTWRDWAVLVVLVALAVLEVVLDDVVWPPIALAVSVFVALLMPWRRAYPFAVVLIGFGIQGVSDVVTLFAADGGTALGSTAFGGLIITYALLRWASGRQAAIGLAFILVAHVLSSFNDPTVGVIEGIVGSAFWLFPAALGASIRYRVRSRQRALEDARLRERQELARELHDSVAHHVTAIVVQAQAGRALASSKPEVAVDVLAVIEEAASKALTEMRTMVGTLRDGEDAVMTPRRGLSDLEQLASDGTGPHVEFDLNGDLDALTPSLESALYRLTQEALTNVRRHARHATRVSVQVVGDSDSVTLRIEDNGDNAGATLGSGVGYGLVGMTERAKLLGGTLEAGPSPERGWTVIARLPRIGSPT